MFINLKFYFVLSIFILVHKASWGQDGFGNKSKSFQHTPTSAKLGEFGKYEVSPYSGQADLKIPLADFKHKDIEIPLSLKYNTAGNKVNEHPSFVGLGWTLMAGGSIVRVVNDEKDELTSLELNRTITDPYVNGNPGYYYKGRVLYEGENWETVEQVEKYNANNGLMYVDSEPDEFIFNFCGYSGSFYINPEGVVGVKKSALSSSFIADVIPELSVEYPKGIVAFNLEGNEEHSNYTVGNDLQTKSFKYFNGFTIILTNGDRYIFGGDEKSIEFTSRYVDKDNFIFADPTSWMLKKIITAKGDVVNFEYKHIGTPMVVSNNYIGYSYYPNGATSGYHQGLSPDERDVISVNFLQPLYLSKIESGDGLNKIEFNYSRSIELKQTLNSKQNNILNLIKRGICYYPGTMLNKYNESIFDWSNYWMQLDDIIVNGKSKLHFTFTNNAAERLKLISILHLDVGGQTYGSHEFTYNSRQLPEYNTRMVDNWGYYNGILYGASDIECQDIYCTDRLYGKRESDSLYAKSEILESIKYPAGGKSVLKYQLNDYSSYVDKSEEYKLVKELGVGGGLRINKVVNYAQNGDIVEEKEYRYVDENGFSSGILSGKPTYNAKGSIHEKSNISGWSGLVHYRKTTDITWKYNVSSEHSLSTLTLSNRNAITYSRVEEHIKGNGKKVYYFDNYDTTLDTEPNLTHTNGDGLLFFDACTSKVLERGRQTRIETWNANGNKTEQVDFFYNNDITRYNSYLRAFKYSLYNYGAYMYRFSTYRVYSFNPYLKRKVSTKYNENSTPIITEESYSYNADNLLSKTVTKQSDGQLIKTKRRYVNDILSSFTGSAVKRDSDVSLMAFDKMKDLNMISYPIEEVRSLISNGSEKTIDARVNLYRLNNNFPVLSETRGLKANIGVTDYDSLNYAKEISRDYQYWSLKTDPRLFLKEQYIGYDTVNNNLLEVVGKDGTKTSYLWDYNGRNVIAVANNMSYEALQGVAGAVPNSTNQAVIMAYLQKLRSKVNSPSVLLSTYTYHPHLGMTSAINPQGIKTVYRYDPLGRLSHVLQNEDVAASYYYNYNGQTAVEKYFGNDAVVRTFSKACPIGAIGSTITYTVPSNTYISMISKLDANAQAQADADVYGQEYTNENGVCTFYNDVMDGTFTKNSCPSGGTGGRVTYTVPAGKHSSIVDKAEANAKAQADIDANGQAYANEIGICTFYNAARSQTFTRNDCPSTAVGSQVTYAVPAGKHSSTISQADADEKAEQDVSLNGQAYANRTGTCTQKEPPAGEPSILYPNESLGKGQTAEIGTAKINLKGDWRVYVEGNFYVTNLTGGKITSGYGPATVRVMQTGPVSRDFDFAGKITFVGSPSGGFTCTIQ